jgi:arabinose-5-phosphate isomerase
MGNWKDSIGELAGKPVVRLGKAVRDVMRRGVLTCRVDSTVAEVAILMAKNRADAVAVVDADGEVVGLISDVDVARAYAEKLDALSAESIMQPKSPIVAPDMLVIEATHIMRDRDVRHLLIKGETMREVPVGIVSAMDIVRDMAGVPPERPSAIRPKGRV